MEVSDLQQNFKREFVIAQLVQLGIKEIDGKSLHTLDYRTLHKTLAIKRAAKQ